MTIRILTCHPALCYVLNRTAPMGTTVRFNHRAAAQDGLVCDIEIESKINQAAEEASVLVEWLPQHVLYYGARSMEVNGRSIGIAEHELRHALHLTRRKRAA